MRTELLGQLVAAQFALEASLVSAAPGSAVALTREQLALVTQLQRHVGSADPAALIAMRAEVAAIIAQAQEAAQQARTASVAADQERDDAVADIAAATRQAVIATMADMHRFEPYLRFASPGDENEYRRRESERQAYIDAELAKGTPQGDLNASAGAVGQMADAYARGAGDSPELQARWDELVATTARLREAARAQGISTEEFDNRLREDLRRILKSKGLSDAQIDAHFAANPDPLEAAKAYVSQEDIEQASRTIAGREHDAVAQATPVSDTPLPEPSLDAVMAKFRGAGIVSAEHPADATFEHGVQTAERPQPTPGISV